MSSLFERVCQALPEAFGEAKEVNSGQRAEYIPELACVDPSHFGVAICDVRTGKTFSLGDSNMHFTMQSTIMPLIYVAALEKAGQKEVHKHVGYEPSGQRYNAFVLDEDNKPHNPLVNAGAIMCAAIIRSKLTNQVQAFKAVKRLAEECSGSPEHVRFENSTFLSEQLTSNRNYALAHFLRQSHELLRTVSIDSVLELYFWACSLTTNAQGLANIAATFANGGVCPVTQKVVMQQEHALHCLQIMFNCGLYDSSGRFSFEAGIPGKSGVSGALFLSIPGELGIAIWSPPLDRHGNSVRGLALAAKLVEKIPELHIFGAAMKQIESRVVKVASMDVTTVVYTLIQAAVVGNTDQIRDLIENYSVDVNVQDYDGRTALHLAAVEGQLDAIQQLLGYGADCDIKDRFGNTPRSEAASKRLGHLMPENTTKPKPKAAAKPSDPSAQGPSVQGPSAQGPSAQGASAKPKTSLSPSPARKQSKNMSSTTASPAGAAAKPRVKPASQSKLKHKSSSSSSTASGATMRPIAIRAAIMQEARALEEESESDGVLRRTVSDLTLHTSPEREQDPPRAASQTDFEDLGRSRGRDAMAARSNACVIS